MSAVTAARSHAAPCMHCWFRDSRNDAALASPNAEAAAHYHDRRHRAPRPRAACLLRALSRDTPHIDRQRRAPPGAQLRDGPVPLQERPRERRGLRLPRRAANSSGRPAAGWWEGHAGLPVLPAVRLADRSSAARSATLVDVWPQARRSIPLPKLRWPSRLAHPWAELAALL
jgi:hypothetical protein